MNSDVTRQLKNSSQEEFYLDRTVVVGNNLNKAVLRETDDDTLRSDSKPALPYRSFFWLDQYVSGIDPALHNVGFWDLFDAPIYARHPR